MIKYAYRKNTRGGKMKTEKLYEKDPFIKEFDAQVISSRFNGKTVEVVLDRTAFFPEGGGQGCDVGMLGGSEVLKTKIVDGEIVHFCGKALPKGAKVKGAIDFPRRLRMMQCHTGEHLTSGLVKSLFGVDNVGFNLSDERVTVDTSGALSEAQIRELEREINRVIRADVQVRAWYPGHHELNSLDIRSKIELKPGVRVVEIEGVDLCACCAPHLSSTGQIGFAHIAESLNYKGGTRMYILFGEDAVRDARERHDALNEVARLFSAKPLEAAQAAKKYVEEKEALERKLAALIKEKLTLRAIELAALKKNPVVFDEELSPKDCVTFCDALMTKSEGLCGAFAPKEGGGFAGVIGKRKGGMKELLPVLRDELLARGGGTDEMFHGTLQADKEKIKSFFGSFS
ncbi:MAG: alanyl-tRNA editing protein [Clostridia bacterium]|nr:alanyl-tRNA editing protein [Clostridia bacterium]